MHSPSCQQDIMEAWQLWKPFTLWSTDSCDAIALSQTVWQLKVNICERLSCRQQYSVMPEQRVSHLTLEQSDWGERAQDGPREKVWLLSQEL